MDTGNSCQSGVSLDISPIVPLQDPLIILGDLEETLPNYIIFFTIYFHTGD